MTELVQTYMALFVAYMQSADADNFEQLLDAMDPLWRRMTREERSAVDDFAVTYIQGLGIPGDPAKKTGGLTGNDDLER